VFIGISEVSVAKNPGINTRSFSRSVWKDEVSGRKPEILGWNSEILDWKPEVSGWNHEVLEVATRSFGLNSAFRNFRNFFLPECFGSNSPKFLITVCLIRSQHSVSLFLDEYCLYFKGYNCIWDNPPHYTSYPTIYHHLYLWLRGNLHHKLT
jgi:hypothetical protein